MLGKIYRRRMLHNQKKKDEMFKVFRSAYAEQVEIIKYLRTLGVEEVRQITYLTSAHK